MRVAYASPFPPLTSGIADYSRELAPRLAECGLELELFHEGPTPPVGAALERFRRRPVGELPSVAAGFDLVLYHLGNSLPHHAGILDALLAAPGVVVLHEFMLHHLVRERTLGAGDARAYVDEMRYAAGETGRRAAQRLLDTHYPLDVWSFPLFERIVDRSRAVLVHSEFARDRVRASRPRARVEVVPFPVELERSASDSAPAERARERAALGLPAEAFVIAAFGFVTPQKRLAPALAAFARLRAERPAARFLVAGEISPHYEFDALLDAVGREGVVVTGRLPDVQFRAALGAVDLAVNLRHPTGGETSASLLRLLAAGVPTAVSRTGGFAELPDGAVAKIPIDEREEELLLALYRAAAEDEALRRALGAAGRRHVERVHALPAAAVKWRSVLEGLEGLEGLERLAGLAAAPPSPMPPMPSPPPLAAWDGVDPRIALAASLGADLADLGLGDTEPELVAELAAVVAELGLAPAPERKRPR